MSLTRSARRRDVTIAIGIRFHNFILVMGVLQDSLLDGGGLSLKHPLWLPIPSLLLPPGLLPLVAQAQSHVCPSHPHPCQVLNCPKTIPGPYCTSHSLLVLGTRPDSASCAPCVPPGSRAIPHEDLSGRKRRENVLRSQRAEWYLPANCPRPQL